jgi:hypothetical protein
MKDEMGRTYSMHGRERVMHIKFWWDNQKERDHWENLDIDGRIALGWK